jgi:hypothetical protein
MLHNVPNVNGSLKGRGINLRSLTPEKRAELAAAAQQGGLALTDLTMQQAAAIFRVPVSRIYAAIRRHHQATPAA